MTETKVSAYNHSGEAELLLLALMWSSSAARRERRSPTSTVLRASLAYPMAAGPKLLFIADWRCWRRCAGPRHGSAACPWHGGRASTDFTLALAAQPLPRPHHFQFAGDVAESTLTPMIDCLLVSIRKKLAACALLPIVWSRHRAATSRPSPPRCYATAHCLVTKSLS